MWLLIHAGIKLNHVSKRGHWWDIAGSYAVKLHNPSKIRMDLFRLAGKRSILFPFEIHSPSNPWIINPVKTMGRNCSFTHPDKSLVKLSHYSDVNMSAIASQITSVSIVYATVCFQGHIKENIKALRHLPLWGEFTGDRRIPLTKGQ